ncbi:MAG: hypothetical protein II072_10080 [Clostridia bacterium]|nr:hypothetical protein [Clostridia bacterium]
MERSIKASSWVIGKVQGRFLIKTGCLEDYIFRRLRPTAIRKKVSSLIPGKKTRGCSAKTNCFAEYISRQTVPDRDPSRDLMKSPSNYMWQKNRRVFGVKRLF